jgi:hypothetical protein
VVVLPAEEVVDVVGIDSSAVVADNFDEVALLVAADTHSKEARIVGVAEHSEADIVLSVVVETRAPGRRD